MDLAELLDIAEKERAKRKPIRIRCCVAGSCLFSDSRSVKARLEQAVAEAGLSDSVEVCGVGCLRLCSHGPLVQIDPNGTLYEKVRPIDAASIVAALDGATATAHQGDPGSAFFTRQTPLVLENTGTIDPEWIEAYIAADGYQALYDVLQELRPAAVVDTLTRSGLRGRGGAGYPTGLKWATVAKMPVGPQIAREVAAWALADVQALAVHQLTPELAEILAGAQYALFVDAYPTQAAEVTVALRPLAPSDRRHLSAHVGEPSALLALTNAAYGQYPHAWLISVPASSFDYGMCLSCVAATGVAGALRLIRYLLVMLRSEPCTKSD
jgi:Ni,Fe-hydrogenase maturation factor/(2Fe-2S) ferredoxin